MKFYISFHMSSIISNTKRYDFGCNTFVTDTLPSRLWFIMNRACLFNFFYPLNNGVPIRRFFIVFNSNFLCTAIVDFSSANQRTHITFSSIEAMGSNWFSKTKENIFYLTKIVTNFVVKNYSIAILKTRFMKLYNIFYRLVLSQIQIKL